MNILCSGGSGNFAKEMRASKLRNIVASHWKLTITNLQQSLKLILLSLHEKSGIWNKLERWENLISRCLISWPKIKKIIIVKCLFLFYATTNHFSIGLWYMTKSGFYVTTRSVVGPRSPKAPPNAKLVLKKGHGHCLVVCCGSDPLQLSDSQRNLYIWEICSVNWDAPKTAMPAVSIGQQKGPNSSLQTTPDDRSHKCFKSWTNWTIKFCLTFHIHLTSRQLTTTSSSISTTFCRENTSTTRRRQNMLSKSSSNPKAWVFMLQE